MRQSAIDLNCNADDFLSDKNITVISQKNDGARKYLELPFYCAAWSNIKSVRNAVKCGFRPAWVEMTAKTAAFVDKMNKPPH